MIRRLLGVAAGLLIAGPAAAQPVLYRNATLIDGTGAAARAGVSVLVDGERIAAVAPDGRLAPPTGARVVDLSGRFLTPGLIDSHEHLATPPNRRQAEASLRRDLYGGVTAVRDMADDLRSVAELTRASRRGEIAAPDIYYAALMAGPSFFADPRTVAVSYGYTPGRTPWMQAIDAKTDLREAVTLARGTSATAIKIYANLPAGLVKKIAAEAHRQGVKVWAHAAVYPATPADVAAARPDVMSHACSLAHAAAGTPASYQSRTPIDAAPFLASDDPAVGKVVRKMAADGIMLDATTSLYGRLSAEAASHPGARRPLCSGELSDALVRQALKAGVEISAGTDWVAPWDEPWPTLFQEMAALTKLGLTPAQVIRAATLNGARAAGQEADMGSIETGKLANLAVFARDPSADIANLKSLEFTVKRGREYRRADFKPLTKDEMLDAE
ncbi:amidohydrolase family protein [Phenylobacterium sp.]|uniref:amidohydrolase family protein n=1 Tax=Phenylobacterium sp. TaxID=1871053 RepID=UPI0025E4A725|nr:amidohydrolase family protein [Phenylobacterium sp.]MBX3485150.1 amidohydrolase family protein [Phenylobacterium sp.]MCW5759864.1 amidohydrolase family protein [Phenylobacterium sp.]